MAPLDPPDLVEDEENYHESSDEDFNPSAVLAADSSSSSDDEDSAPTAVSQTVAPSRKREAPSPTDLDSGDEVTIEAARKRRVKKRKGEKDSGKGDIVFSDDEGGEGGLIKTRAQRRIEQKERRPLARTDGATIDVDAIWAQMSIAPLLPPRTTTKPVHDAILKESKAVASDVEVPVDREADTVMVKRIYTFAGQKTTEEKQIPRSSLDQHIADGWKTADAQEAPVPGKADDAPEDKEIDDPSKKMRRPLRRPSRFDPNPMGQVRGLPPELQLTWPRKRTAPILLDQENAATPVSISTVPLPEKAQKLNVIDKSRMDWTGYVDKEGIAEELQEHGRAKEAYLGRMDFLAGVEARREEERLRLKGVTAP